MGYMAAALFFGIIWFFFYGAFPRLRTCLVVSGFLFLPAGFSEALFVPDYWNPQVIGRLSGFDAESLLFAFFTGGIAAVLYPAVSGHRFVSNPGKARRYQVHLFWLVPAVAAVLLVWVAVSTDISVLHTAFAIFLIGIIHMRIVRPDLFGACLWGALLFLLLYSCVLFISVWLFQESLLGSWKTAPLFGLRLFRVPVDEFVYALLFGGLWSTVYCGVFNYRLVHPGIPQQNSLPGKTKWTRRVTRIFF